MMKRRRNGFRKYDLLVRPPREGKKSLCRIDSDEGSLSRRRADWARKKGERENGERVERW